MKKTWQQIHEELMEPFPHEDVEWKIQTVSKDKTRGLAVGYVTARAIQNRLDAVVGAENWKPVFSPWHTVDRDGKPVPSQLCSIMLYDDERKEWLAKTDGAENTDIEPVKGGLSDAMKRAASQWGIGRYLYKLDTLWVNLESGGRKICDSERQRLDRIHDQLAARLKGNAPAAGPENTSSKQAALKPSPHFIIRKATAQRFKSGLITILDLAAENGEVFTVFCQTPDEGLKEGAVLTQVRIRQLPGRENPNRRYNSLEGYHILRAA